MKIYTDTAVFKTFELKDKVKCFNGSGTSVDKSADEVLSLFYNTANEFQPQLIKFMISGEKLTGIKIAKDNQTNGVYDNNVFSKNLYKKDGSFYNGLFNSKYSVTPKTVIFRIPQDITKESLFNMSRTIAWSQTFDYTTIFDSDDMYNCGAVIVGGPLPAQDIIVNSTAYVVDRVVKTFDSHGNEAVKLYLYQGARTGTPKPSSIIKYAYTDAKSVTTASDNVAANTGYNVIGLPITSLESGDVIYFATDSDDKITKFKFLFRSNYPTVTIGPETVTYREFEGGPDWSSILAIKPRIFNKVPNTATNATYVKLKDTFIAYGQILRVKDNKIVIFSNSDDINAARRELFVRPYIIDNVLIYYKASKKLMLGTKDDLAPGDKILITTSWSKISTILVVKE